MILSKIISIKLYSNNISHYLSLGYIIPLYTDKWGRSRIKNGTTLNIKISDLPLQSREKVLCRCDECQDTKWIIYQNLINSNSYKNGKYLCKHCCLTIFSWMKIRTKENHPNWNPNLTNEERQNQHGIHGIMKWKKSVKKRDNHTCQCCSSKDSLCAHHINNFKNFKEQRLDINNGITLCKDCHCLIHKIFGKFTNKENLLEFISYFKKSNR